MLRLIDITNVLIKYQLDQYLLRNPASRFIAKGAQTLFGIKTVGGPAVQRARLALEELGPVFIKLGQMISSRPDIFPQSLVTEFSRLRENVNPISTKIVIQTIEEDLGSSINSVFKTFDRNAVAAGSVAQVHYAVLHNGDEVAVKVLRPGIEKVINNDINLVRQILPMVEMYKPILKQFNISKVIDELHTSILKELDLTIEANNIERFANNMQICEFVITPKVYKEFSSPCVLTMQRMMGVPIDNVEKLREQGVDINQVVMHGVEALMMQIFYYGFFHADQHPGNLWIQPDGKRVYLDFGIMGEITEADRKTLLKILFHLYGKNYNKIIDAVTDAGWAPASLNKELLQINLGEIALMLVNRRQADFSLGTVISTLFTTFRKFEIQIPYQFTLLVKTILVTEGLSKQLAPDLNIQAAAEPVLIKHFLKSTAK